MSVSLIAPFCSKAVKKGILPVDVHSKGGDHDFHVASLTPIVNLVMNFDVMQPWWGR